VTTQTTLTILAFIGMGTIIVVAGARLVRYAEGISERTRLGQVWTGAVLVATVTSPARARHRPVRSQAGSARPCSR
jgi:Ca2+/Na+ antiporter